MEGGRYLLPLGVQGDIRLHVGNGIAGLVRRTRTGKFGIPAGEHIPGAGGVILRQQGALTALYTLRRRQVFRRGAAHVVAVVGHRVFHRLPPGVQCLVSRAAQRDLGHFGPTLRCVEPAEKEVAGDAGQREKRNGGGQNGIAVRIGIFRAHGIFVPDVILNRFPKDFVPVVADTDPPAVTAGGGRTEGEGVLAAQHRIGHS